MEDGTTLDEARQLAQLLQDAGVDAIHVTAFDKEQESAIGPSEKPKGVLVIGGEPTGMEAAIIASIRGHHVELLEKDRKLGGQLLLGGILRQEYATLNRYFNAQLKWLGVRVRRRHAFTPKLFNSFHPNVDVVVLATGPLLFGREIPGRNGPTVISDTELRKRKPLWFPTSVFSDKRWIRPVVDRVIKRGCFSVGGR